MKQKNQIKKLIHLPKTRVSKKKLNKAQKWPFTSLQLYRGFVGLFIGIFLFVFCYPLNSSETSVAHASPDIANLHFAWHIEESEIKELAKWDVVVLDMENQVANPEAMRKIKEANPKIILLAYITSQEIRDDALGTMRKKLASGIKEGWYLYNSDGTKYSYWPGTHMLNVSESCPVVDGKKFNQYLAEFVSQEILATGLWDGVLYDNAWEGLDWYTKGTADLNKDGIPETNVDSDWRSGYDKLFSQTHLLTQDKYLIVGNLGPGHTQYTNSLDGAMIENFPQFGWKHAMSAYDEQESKGKTSKVIIINGNTGNSGNKNDFRAMRYGLASTLLGDGYYSFDHGDQDHNQQWWYDEYNVNLGEATSDAVSVSGKNGFDESDVWKREYSNGVALVNPTNQIKEVNLGGEYEKIIGTQDPKVNDGTITDRVKIGSKDGLIMLKTFQSLKQTVFKNGSFLRFFKIKGERSRNGLFAFEEGVNGGARVYVGDINNDGQEEKIVASQGKLKVLSMSGQELWGNYPYGDKFKGELNLAVGKLSPFEPAVIIISSPVQGSMVQYTSSGERIKEVFPLDKKFKGGLSVAIGNIDNDEEGEVVVGIGKGKLGEVLIYNANLDKIEKRFSPYGKYSSGIEVALGDMQRDGKKEIITISFNATPQLRVFDKEGKKISEFRAQGVLGAKKLFLTSADVNNDGFDEIVLMND